MDHFRNDLRFHSKSEKAHRFENLEIMSNPKLDGHPAMRQWDPSYRHHHLPQWMKRAIKAQLVALGKWDPGSHHENQMGKLYPWNFFDHWGSVVNVGDPKQRKFVSQPYGSRDYTQSWAQDFADRHGLSLEVISPAIWHCNATTFIWTP